MLKYWMIKKLLFISLILLAALIYYLIPKNKVQDLTKKDVLTSLIPKAFESMTIPYLRHREYKSQLNDLKEYSKKNSYTTYLTSYDSDGIKINALITKPNTPEPLGGYPGIVFVHGYIPPADYKTTEKYVDYVDYLARNGFVVFKIDLRGHGESDGTPSGAYYSGDYVIDTLNAYDALGKSGFVNPNKIGLWGHSMAGNVTFRAFVAKQNIPALVIWAGAGYTYNDLITYRLSDRSYRSPAPSSSVFSLRKLLTETYGTFDSNNIFWKQIAPTNYLDGVGGAIQIHHAIDDPTVNVEYSRNLIKILDNTNIPHELFEYPSGGHNINGSSFSLAMKRTVEFYKSDLK